MAFLALRLCWPVEGTVDSSIHIFGSSCCRITAQFCKNQTAVMFLYQGTKQKAGSVVITGVEVHQRG